MIKSMTGFGRGEYSDGKRVVTAEIKSVNHRYCDISIRMARRYGFAEERIKKTIKQKVARGKLDVSIVVDPLTESDVIVRLNKPLAEQYIQNLEMLRDEYALRGDLDVQLIAQMPDVLKQISDVEDEDEMLCCILGAVEKAAEALDQMRQTEGEKLARDLIMRGGLISELVDHIEEKAAEVPSLYAQKLRERIAELLEGSVEIPEEKIAVEAAFFADKANITEELIRLRSHMEQLKEIIDSNQGAEGKKLDFLVQEMNREANTIGSKANNIEITNLMLQIKAEVEKIREQVQNIE
jgi:uncharacterized protein (TIGR00255 family)